LPRAKATVRFLRYLNLATPFATNKTVFEQAAKRFRRAE
jgi:hypothetical protein